MDKSKPITVYEVVSRMTGVNLIDTLNAYLESIRNACLESMRKLGKWATITSEKLKETEKMIDSDPILGLLHAICDDDIEALSQIVSKYSLHERNLSYFEREQVRQQLKREDILCIASSAVLIWLDTFPLNYSAYFSLPQEKREKISPCPFS